MDANDIELVSARDQYDPDEVYPGDDLHEGDESYQPHMRKQNKIFIGAFSCLFLLAGIAVGAKMFWFPQAETELEFERNGGDGTVNNNADNAKVKESLVRHKKKKGKSGHAASQWANHQNHSGIDADDSEESSSEPAGRGKEGDIDTWHKTKVSKDDGVMYEIVDTLVHDPNAFLEGLTFANGKLYESVGLRKQSAVKVLDPDTGETIESYPMESSYFGEGLTYYKGKFIQLTYKKRKGFIYDASDLSAAPKTFDFSTTTGEGWGLTYDEKRDEFVVSDGSASLLFWDPVTLQQKRKHQIMRLDGTPARQINELEYWRDRIVANVWFEHVLLIINHVTGLVEKEYDFSTIWEEAGIKPNKEAEVFNGISISDDPDVLYVTGKLWSNMFKVKLLPLIEQ